MRSNIVRSLLLSIVLLLPLRGIAQLSAGGSTDVLRTTSAAYYYVAKSGDLTMQVNIWGFVNNPGRYEVPVSTDIIQLLSYAGGPNQDGDLENVKITRIVKEGVASSMYEYHLDLKNLVDVEQDKTKLYPGDTIYLDHTGWLNVRDVLTVVTAAAVVTAAVANVIIATSR